MRRAVIGMGFGDEGKGCTTSWLSSLDSNATVVRYSGGPQAGHHVMYKDKEHVFASFGSGTLVGRPSFTRGDCVVDPIELMKEYDHLAGMLITPKHTISGYCPIITPMDVWSNQCDNENLSHGTCGFGINATLRREEDHHSILARDLLYPEVLKAKLASLEENYYDVAEDFDPGEFLGACDELIRCVSISDDELILNTIYEGSQGLMLDKDIGIFPNVTPYNVGMKGIGCSVDEAYYVTRPYNTRHGNGDMLEPPVTDYLRIKNNQWEYNHTNEYQGNFRKSILNVDTLEYALHCDEGYLVDVPILVVTCLEHVDRLCYFYKNKMWEFNSREEFCNSLARTLGMEKYVMCIGHKFGKITGVTA